MMCVTPVKQPVFQFHNPGHTTRIHTTSYTGDRRTTTAMSVHFTLSGSHVRLITFRARSNRSPAWTFNRYRKHVTVWV